MPTLYSLSSGSADTTWSVIKYEPRDLDGSVKVFWNHDIVGLGVIAAVDVAGAVVEVAANGVQHEGQRTAGGGRDVAVDVEIDQRSRNGRPSRNCGRPGNSAIRKMDVAITVKYLCWDIVVKDMMMDFLRRLFAIQLLLRHFISWLGEASPG